LIVLKRAEEIEKMRRPGEIVGRSLLLASELIAPGVSTAEINRQVEEFIREQGAIPSFKGYGGFPAACCISVNDVVVHGIPSKSQLLRDGDIVSVDVGAFVDGFHGDAARTFYVGGISEEAERLLRVTREALEVGIRTIGDGVLLGKVSHAIQEFVESAGFSIIRDFVGHGIGKQLHEEPQIPNYGNPRKGPVMRNGMVVAIEPMVCTGDWGVEVMEDGWTARTRDRSLAAHFEDTMAITPRGIEILTRMEK